jgi:hypothetical protein
MTVPDALVALTRGSSYRGVPGGPRDPQTPGGYCLAVCRCGECPQYEAQSRAVALLREQEYLARQHQVAEPTARRARRRGGRS